jgi:hypothetical protein
MVLEAGPSAPQNFGGKRVPGGADGPASRDVRGLVPGGADGPASKGERGARASALTRGAAGEGRLGATAPTASDSPVSQLSTLNSPRTS